MPMTISHFDGSITTISYVDYEKKYYVATVRPDGGQTSSISAAPSETWLDLAKKYAQPGDQVQMDYSDYGSFDPDNSAIPDLTAAQVSEQ